MPARRPRCTCGDLFSEHDWRDQNRVVTDPCRGPVCYALMRLRSEDPCEAYAPERGTYRPLREVVRDFDLTMNDVDGLD